MLAKFSHSDPSLPELIPNFPAEQNLKPIFPLTLA